MDPKRLLDGRLKLRHLVLVTTIAREGTLLRTAEVLHVTQPVVTRGLREAEAALGAELFTRGPRGVRATPAGAILVDHAHRILGSLRAAGTRISELQRVGIEPLRVGTNLAGAHALIPRALIELKRALPDLSASVVEASSEDLGAMLRRSEVDLLVGRLQPPTEGTDEPLRRVRLYDEPVRLVVREGHPSAHTKGLGLEDLLTYPWILPNAPSLLRSEIDDLFRARELLAPADVIECSVILTVQALVHATDSIAPLPVLIGRNTPGLTVLDTDLDTVPRAIGITMLAGVEQPESVQRFVEHLIVVAGDLGEAIAGTPKPRGRGFTPSPRPS